jgi:hypothetical protein
VGARRDTQRDCDGAAGERGGAQVTATIIGPGVHTMPEDAYFAHPALSCSGAKRLLPPSCPAIFRHEQLHGRPYKAAFDLGHAAHKAVLGVGAPLQLVEADDWRTKKAQEQRQVAYDTGAIPLLARDWDHVVGMSQALKAHPIAALLFDPAHGKPEQSLFRTDEQSGVDLRARLDWLPESVDGRMVLADYKTAVSAEPRSFAKAAANYGYHMQHAWYVDMVTGLGLADDVGFVFVVQEKTPPYLVTVVELDVEAVRIGRERNRRAIDLYASCLATDEWPGYSTDIELISLPKWATYDSEDAA